MQLDYPRNIVLKLQVDCMKTQGELALRFLDIETEKRERTKQNSI